MKTRGSERGNIFTMLLGGIVLSGVLGLALFQMMGGPVVSSIVLARKTAAQAEERTVARMIIVDAANQATPDCDGDSATEPKEWRTGSGPTGGGLVPLTIGAPVTDPWGTDYGYCVWDVGAYNDPVVNNGCGANAKRRKGAVNPQTDSAKAQTVIAVVSAGADKTFSTTCSDYTNATTDVILPLGDDVVTRYSYAEAGQATSSLWSMKTGVPAATIIGKDLSVGDGSTTGGITAAALSTSSRIIAGGATKIGDNTNVPDVVCTSGRAGLLRYNAGLAPPAVQFCDGTVFNTIGSGSIGTCPTCASTIDALTDAMADYTSKHTLGLGQDATLNATGGTNSSSSTSYATITKTQGPSAEQATGNNTVTTAAGVTYAMDGGGGRLSAPSAGGTVIVEVSETTSGTFTAAPNSMTVADDHGNTYSVAAMASSCHSTAPPKGAAGIFYYTYAAAPGNTTITVKPVGAASSLTWTVTEYAGIETSSPVDLTGSVTSTASSTTSATVTAGTGTDSGLANKLGIAVLAHCPLANSVDTIAVNTAGSNPNAGPGWTSDYIENSNPTTGSKLANGSGVRQISIAAAYTSFAHVWTFRSGSTTQPRGHVGVIATFKPKATTTVTTTVLPSYLTAVGYQALKADIAGGYNTAMGYNALAANTGDFQHISGWVSSTGAAFGLVRATVASTANFPNNSVGIISGSVGIMLTPSIDGPHTLTVVDGTHIDIQGTSWPVMGGWSALGDIYNGSSNTAVGSSALAANTVSVFNTALGANALAANTTGLFNISIGASALAANTTGGYNTAIGYQALLAMAAATSTSRNALAIGYQAGAALNVSSTLFSTAIGYQALATTTASGVNDYGTAFGYQALKLFPTKADNDTAFGYRAGASETAAGASGGLLTAFGSNACGQQTQDCASAFGANASAASPAQQDGLLAFGYNTLAANTGAAIYNTAFGSSALAASHNDKYNTAFGYGALAVLDKNTSASTSNTAIGYNALAADITGSRNTAIGASALAVGTAPDDNTAFGAYALMNSNAAGNTGIGYQALKMGVGATGTRDTAFGYNALRDTTTGSDNTAVGANALTLNTVGNSNTAIGYNALTSNTGGNYNTGVGYEVLKNNSSSGGGDYGERNTGGGYQALYGNTYGDDNTAAGYQALYTNTTGHDNVAIGYQAMRGSGTGTGSENTAVGSGALGANDVGAANTAVGYLALHANTNGSYNTAVGYNALAVNTTGNYNTAVGYSALAASITDSGSTAVGYNALAASNIGSTNTGNTAFGDSALAALVSDTGNTAFGYRALTAMNKGSTATYNTALGSGALSATTTGTGNTAIGKDALSVNTTGSNNTALGYLAGPSAGNTGLSNTTAIGYNAQVTASNMVRFGDTLATPIGGLVAWAASSDLRLKKDITDSDLGLDFIMKLRPVVYRLIRGDGRLDYGFIAQEVEQALDGRVTNMIMQTDDAMKTYHLRSTDILAPLARAMQQQAAVEEKQRRDMDDLQARLKILKEKLVALKKGKEATHD